MQALKLELRSKSAIDCALSKTKLRMLEIDHSSILKSLIEVEGIEDTSACPGDL